MLVTTNFRFDHQKRERQKFAHRLKHLAYDLNSHRNRNESKSIESIREYLRANDVKIDTRLSRKNEQ